MEPVYRAIWADNLGFDQVLISKRMVQDHMPDKVLEGLEKVRFISTANIRVQTAKNFFLLVSSISRMYVNTCIKLTELIMVNMSTTNS